MQLKKCPIEVNLILKGQTCPCKTRKITFTFNYELHLKESRMNEIMNIRNRQLDLLYLKYLFVF